MINDVCVCRYKTNNKCVFIDKKIVETRQFSIENTQFLRFYFTVKKTYEILVL